MLSCFYHALCLFCIHLAWAKKNSKIAKIVDYQVQRIVGFCFDISDSIHVEISMFFLLINDTIDELCKPVSFNLLLAYIQKDRDVVYRVQKPQFESHAITLFQQSSSIKNSATRVLRATFYVRKIINNFKRSLTRNLDFKSPAFLELR